MGGRKPTFRENQALSEHKSLLEKQQPTQTAQALADSSRKHRWAPFQNCFAVEGKEGKQTEAR